MESGRARLQAPHDARLGVHLGGSFQPPAPSTDRDPGIALSVRRATFRDVCTARPAGTSPGGWFPVCPERLHPHYRSITSRGALLGRRAGTEPRPKEGTYGHRRSPHGSSHRSRTPSADRPRTRNVAAPPGIPRFPHRVRPDRCRLPGTHTDLRPRRTGGRRPGDGRRHAATSRRAAPSRSSATTSARASPPPKGPSTSASGA